MVSVAGMFAMFFMGALYFQRVLGYDALQTGLAFLPATVVMGVLSMRYSERLVMRFGARTTLIAGLGSILAGLLLFTQAPVDGSYLTHGLLVTILIGAGGGTSFPALMTLAMSGATPSDAGLASGLINTTAQVGGALGLAVLATLASTRTANLRAAGDSTLEALNGGYHLAFLIGAGLVLVAIVVALTVITPARQVAGQAAAQQQESGEPAYGEAA
jgi:MFS family permease